MDSEISEGGDVLVCSSTQSNLAGLSPVCNVPSTSQNVAETKSKPRKRRPKPKNRPTVKELETPTNASPDVPPIPLVMENLEEMISGLAMSTQNDIGPQKQKKTMKREKIGIKKENKDIQPHLSECATQCNHGNNATRNNVTRGSFGRSDLHVGEMSKNKLAEHLNFTDDKNIVSAANDLNFASSSASQEIAAEMSAVLQQMSDIQNLIRNLNTSAQKDEQKPKRVRKHKKKDGEKDNEEIRANGVGARQFNDIIEGVKNEGHHCKHRGPSVGAYYPQSPQQLRVQTPTKKGLEPFFSDNKNRNKRKSSGNNKTQSDKFDDYITLEEVEQGLKDKTMIAGPIRINPKSYKEAYITGEGGEKDIMIEGIHSRNRALEGDEVVVLINPPDAWKEKTGQKTGKVVFIREKFHSRSCIGRLPAVVEPATSYLVFSPRDARVPRIKISPDDSQLPPSYFWNPTAYRDTIFNVKITVWTDVNFAQGTIVAEVGKVGEVEAETLAILLENGLDPNPIDPLLSMFFPRMPYEIPKEEIAKRENLRRECIFTIDPATARDLDDAVSAKRLENGNIEVGVHISDVSHFLEPNTMLDHTVSKRATTIYLVQRVYHMLPVELCNLCSLTPGEDKLAFSVFVELNAAAEVVSHRFARSVIHSCAKLAYEHAQIVIDNPEKTVTPEDFPDVTNGFSAEDCAATIRELFKLSVIMRERRFDSGALRIDQPKLCFHLDPKTQKPLDSFIYENKESHRLIEEFMLLANMTVAEHIYKTYPKLAFLRQHLPPKINMMCDLKQRLETYGIHLDISDAGTIHSSMRKYSCPLPDEDEVMTWARHIVLNNLCAKPMLRANYFCPSDENNILHHYALNAPCYTHFTSPIRRYADVMVHRLLAASLDMAPQPTWTYLDTKRIATVCNRQKQSAKTAGEQSSLLFLALHLSEPIESAAAVIDVKDRSFDVIVRDFGVTLRVYTDPLPAKIEFCRDDNMPQLYIKWQGGKLQLIQLFTVVRVKISVMKTMDNMKLVAELLPAV